MNRQVLRCAAVLAVVAGSMLIASDAQAFFGCCRRQTCCYQPVTYTYYSAAPSCGCGYSGSSCGCNSGCGCSSGGCSSCNSGCSSCGSGCSSCSAYYAPAYQPAYAVRPYYAPTYVGYSAPRVYEYQQVGYQQVGTRVRIRY